MLKFSVTLNARRIMGYMSSDLSSEDFDMVSS